MIVILLVNLGLLRLNIFNQCQFNRVQCKYRAGTYFDADQKWRTEMHSGFIYEPQNLSSFYLHVGKHLHDRIISMRGEVWAHKHRLAPPLLISSSCTNPGTMMYMYVDVWGIEFDSVSMIFSI